MIARLNRDISRLIFEAFLPGPSRQFIKRAAAAAASGDGCFCLHSLRCQFALIVLKLLFNDDKVRSIEALIIDGLRMA